jgi:hypothetical protein
MAGRYPAHLRSGVNLTAGAKEPLGTEPTFWHFCRLSVFFTAHIGPPQKLEIWRIYKQLNLKQPRPDKTFAFVRTSAVMHYGAQELGSTRHCTLDLGPFESLYRNAARRCSWTTHNFKIKSKVELLLSCDQKSLMR